VESGSILPVAFTPCARNRDQLNSAMQSDGNEHRKAIGSVISKSVAGKLRNAANTIKPPTIPARAARGGASKLFECIATASDMRVGIVKCGHIGIGSPEETRRFCTSW